jgi:hypothetical protein
MYMDIHEVPGVTAEDVAKAHLEDVRIPANHGVEYLKYWLNQKQGKIYCLCTAPNAKAADAARPRGPRPRGARILKVTPDLAEAFMGVAEIGKALPFRDVGPIALKGFDQPVHVHSIRFASNA